MYQEHADFKRPDDSNATIWRFMDFTKLLWLLETSSLWFARVDTLGDPFEASWLPFVPAGDRGAGSSSEIFKGNLNIKKWQVATQAVNCWHMNDVESEAMWRLYTLEGQGIALQSTFQSLTECFGTCQPFISVGMVSYIDYAKDMFDSANTFVPFLHKRNSFAHEQEVRAIAWPPGGEPHDTSPIAGGIAVHVDLKKLVHRVYVSPTAPPWVHPLTKSIVQRYVNVPVDQSILLARPPF